jgi:CheY-like chemotaxis protein/anti-sigma regulatory factor (Ser/Thr protein kinase)
MPIVLVVDDSPMDRLVVGRLLEKEQELDWVFLFASNGDEALGMMHDLVPHVVVTDLIMPGMDGLELVERIREEHPEVPVILITGMGSESLAIEALERGAASYVPKNQLASKLLDTVKQVLTVAHADTSRQRLADCFLRTGVTVRLDNDPALIPPLVNLIEQMLRDVKFADAAERIHLGIALEEAILNAMLHGNLDLSPEQVAQARAEFSEGKFSSVVHERRLQPPYHDRRVLVDAQISPEEVRFRVRDDGPGFACAAVPQRGDPTCLERGGGRGLVLMRNFMDEVVFNDAGNEVTLVKRQTGPRIVKA